MKAILILIFILMSFYLWGAILTVDNNIPSAGQYTTLQAAHDAATSGDIIHVYPSNTTYAGITVTKTLSIIGSGWEPVNMDNYIIKNTVISGVITFVAGSENSKLQGFGGAFGCSIDADGTRVSNLTLGGVAILSDNNTMDKCIASYVSISGNHNQLKRSTITGGGSGTSITLNGAISALVANNIIRHNLGWGTVISYANETTVIINNTFAPAYPVSVCTGYNFFFTNNVLYGGGSLSSLNTINQDYNVQTTDAANFVDSEYHLAPGSVAIDAGNPDIGYNDLDGSRNDCGAYGGPDPLVNGATVSPYIYEINATPVNSGAQDWQVQIKARASQE